MPHDVLRAHSMRARVRTSVAFVRLEFSFAQGRFTIATLDGRKDLEAMVARGGRLQFRGLASRIFGLVEFSLGKKNTGQADSGLVGEGSSSIDFRATSRPLQIAK